MVPGPTAHQSGAMDNPSPTSEHPTPPPPGPRVSREEMKDLGRLRRSATDRHIAGVAGGIARHLDIDPIIVRVALVVGVFFGGAGLLAYVGAWVLVPEEGTPDEPLGLDNRSRSLALAGVGVLALLCAVGDWAGAFWFPWPLAVLAAFAVWFLHRKDRGAPGPLQPPAHGTAPAPSYGPVHGPAPEPPAAPGYWAGAQEPPPPAPPASYARVPRTPRNPRKRGPFLFLPTVALIALAEGVLGVVDLAGIGVADSAYPTLALGIIAAMLVVGSFWGRAGGLIALGLVAALLTVGATLSSAYPEDRDVYTPTRAAEVPSAYDLGGGELVLDLSGVDDVSALDGREIAVDGLGGRVEVVVPDGVDVAVSTQTAAGDSRVFGQRSDGLDVTLDGYLDGGDDAPELSITVDLLVGEIIVREAA